MGTFCKWCGQEIFVIPDSEVFVHAHNKMASCYLNATPDLDSTTKPKEPNLMIESADLGDGFVVELFSFQRPTYRVTLNGKTINTPDGQPVSFTNFDEAVALKENWR